MRSFFGATLLLVPLAFSLPAAFDPPWPPPVVQEATLLPLPGEGNGFDHCGAVALDGDTLVVGCPGHDYHVADSGAALVFARDGDSWRLEARLTGSGGPGSAFGQAVAVSGDTVVVGSCEDGELGRSSGAVYLFVRADTVWVRQQRIPGPAAYAYFGSAVAVDGDTALVGAFRDNSEVGSATVFARSGGLWTQEAVLAPSSTAAGFGTSVALDGDVAVVGAPSDAPLGGAAFLFRRGAGGWAEEERLDPSQPEEFGQFGCSVAVRGDTVLVGAKGESTSGAAYAFDRIAGAWALSQRLDPGASQGVEFGQAVALDGESALVGAPEYPSSGGGAAFVYVRFAGSWVLEAQLDGADASGSSEFGCALGLDGERALVGAWRADAWGEDSGAAFVFERTGTAWAEDARLLGPGSAAGDVFGAGIALLGDLAAVGAPGDDDGVQESGAAYAFRRHGATWSLEAKLKAPDPAYGADFGRAVAVTDGAVLIGAPGWDADPDHADSGAVYVFVPGRTGWTYHQTLLPPTPVGDGFFGAALAIDGDTAVVGVPWDQIGPGEVQGSVQVFDRSGGDWSFSQRITHVDLGIDDNLGQAVTVNGDTMLLGSPDFDEAHVLVRSAGWWGLQATLEPTGGLLLHSFGHAVALEGDLALVTSPNEDRGTGYLFRRLGSSWSLEQKLVPAGTNFVVRFGASAALGAGMAVFGVPEEQLTAYSSGAAHLFVERAGVWEETSVFAGSSTGEMARFGTAASLSGDTALIAAESADGDYAGSGVVCSFRVGSLLFANGFEDGSSSAWSVTVPPRPTGLAAP